LNDSKACECFQAFEFEALSKWDEDDCRSDLSHSEISKLISVAHLGKGSGRDCSRRTSEKGAPIGDSCCLSLAKSACAISSNSAAFGQFLEAVATVHLGAGIFAELRHHRVGMHKSLVAMKAIFKTSQPRRAQHASQIRSKRLPSKKVAQWRFGVPCGVYVEVGHPAT
jgi:hypothetical protein